MRFSKALGLPIAIVAICAAAAPVRAYDPNPPRDPRTIGLTPVWVGSRDEEIIRVDRGPDGNRQRCVLAARLRTPEDGGPSAVEFGVERIAREPSAYAMYFRLRYLDGPNGAPLAVRDPVMMFRFFGPSADWRIEPQRGGWIRASKPVARAEPREQLAFVNATQRPGNQVVATYPDGTHRLHSLRGGLSPWHFEMFWRCACALTAELPKDSVDGFPCP